MAKIQKFVIAIIAIVASGCSILPEVSPKYSHCVIGGAIAGAAYQEIDNGGEDALSGAAKGAALGGLLCAIASYKPEPSASELDTDLDGVADDRDQCPATPQIAQVDANGCPLDVDADGVPDFRDDCPATPAIAKVNSRGCPLDMDKDGVPDFRDDCPLTKRGMPVNSRGCPRDSDSDGVLDINDKCPGTPRGTKVDQTGCPLPPAELPWMSPVLFDFDSSLLTHKTVENLKRLAGKLVDRNDYFLTVIGHTDSVGSIDYNMDLSIRRAEAAEALLIQLGIPASRIQAVGAGEADPAASNASERGRSLNRRVEVEAEIDIEVSFSN